MRHREHTTGQVHDLEQLSHVRDHIACSIYNDGGGSVIPFKRALHVGMRGSDAKAVKIALMHTKHAHGFPLAFTRLYSRHAAADLKTFQKHHKLPADGIYGPKTHEKLWPYFTRYAKWLYKRQKVVHPMPNSAKAAALRLMTLHREGKFRDDRGTCYAQVVAAAQGKPVRNAIGQEVFLNAKMLEVLVWLIDVKHFEIGVFAICSDHGFDSEMGHAGGHAVDISSINGVSILSSSVFNPLMNVLKDLHSAGALKPWQLISGGYANQHNIHCMDECIPSAAFYGEPTLTEHCNHVHVGY